MTHVEPAICGSSPLSYFEAYKPELGWAEFHAEA